MMALALVMTLSAGLALALRPRLHWRRWLHRLAALSFVCIAVNQGAVLLAGGGVLVASAGLLAARLPDRDWGLAILLAHGFGAVCLLFLLGLQPLR